MIIYYMLIATIFNHKPIVYVKSYESFELCSQAAKDLRQEAKKDKKSGSIYIECEQLTLEK